jgi:Fe-S oxidoreductase
MRGIKKVFDPKGILNPGKLGLDGKERGIFDHFAYTKLLERPEGLVSFGDAVDDEVLICVQCGFCIAQCPIYPETHAESSVGRGKVQLAYSILTGKLEANVEVANRFFECTTCANCTFTCPSRIKIVDVVERVREYLTQQGFGKPEHRRVMENILKYHNPFGEDEGPRENLRKMAGGEHR